MLYTHNQGRFSARVLTIRPSHFRLNEKPNKMSLQMIKIIWFFVFLSPLSQVHLRARSLAHTLSHTIYDFCQQRNLAALWMCSHNSLSIGKRFAKRMRWMKSWKFTRNVIFISHTLHATHTQNTLNQHKFSLLFFRLRELWQCSFHFITVRATIFRPVSIRIEIDANGSDYLYPKLYNTMIM